MPELEQHIDDYINGKLSPAEVKAFELLIAKDDELLERVNVYRDLNNVLIDGANSSIDQKSKRQEEFENLFSDPDGKRVLNSIQKAEHAYFDESQSKDQSFNAKPFIFGLLILAVALIAYVFFNMKESEGRLYASLSDYSYLPSLTSRSNQNDLAKGEEAFNNKRYQEALDYFKNYIDVNKDTFNFQVELYMACCLLELDQNQNAIVQLNKIISSESMDIGIARWYLVNAYLKTDQKTNAVSTLELIKSDPKNFNYQEAINVLSNLADTTK